MTGSHQSRRLCRLIKLQASLQLIKDDLTMAQFTAALVITVGLWAVPAASQRRPPLRRGPCLRGVLPLPDRRRRRRLRRCAARPELHPPAAARRHLWTSADDLCRAALHQPGGPGPRADHRKHLDRCDHTPTAGVISAIYWRMRCARPPLLRLPVAKACCSWRVWPCRRHADQLQSIASWFRSDIAARSTSRQIVAHDQSRATFFRGFTNFRCFCNPQF